MTCSYAQSWGCNAEAEIPAVERGAPAFCKHHAVLFLYLLDGAINLGQHDQLAALPVDEMMRRLAARRTP